MTLSLGFLCLNSSGVGTPHSKQMPGHYTVLNTLRIHGLLNRELAVFIWLACKELFLYEFISTIAALQNTNILIRNFSTSMLLLICFQECDIHNAFTMQSAPW